MATRARSTSASRTISSEDRYSHYSFRPQSIVGDRFLSYSYRSSYAVSFTTDRSVASMSDLRGDGAYGKSQSGKRSWKKNLIGKISHATPAKAPKEKEQSRYDVYGCPKRRTISQERTEKQKQRVYDLSAFGKKQKRFLGGGEVVYVNKKKRIEVENIPLYIWETEACRAWIAAVLNRSEEVGSEDKGKVEEPKRRLGFGLGWMKKEDNVMTEKEIREQRKREKMIMRYKGDGMLLYAKEEAGWIKMFGEHESGHKVWRDISDHRKRFQEPYDEWDKMVSGGAVAKAKAKAREDWEMIDERLYLRMPNFLLW